MKTCVSFVCPLGDSIYNISDIWPLVSWFHQVLQRCWFWNSFPINQSDLEDKFTVYGKFRVWCFYISVIHLLFPL